MNKFNCFNNMQISRYAAIKYAQSAANANLTTLFNASTNGGWGVLTSMATEGMLPDEDTALKVAKLAGSSTIVVVQPGVAIMPNGDLAVNDRAAQVDVSTVSSPGIYNLYIKYAVEYKMTGEETFYSGHTSSTIGTLEEDSCEFELSATTITDGVLLARILYQETVGIVADVVATGATLPSDSDVIYPSDTGIAWDNIASIHAEPAFALFPYVRIGNEYLNYVGVNTWTRGMYATHAPAYYYGTVYPVTWSPVIDARQTNVYRFNIQLAALDTISQGITQRSGGEYRHYELVLKKAPPEIPTINTSNTEVIWLNSHLAAGYLTADMIAAYEQVQGIQESINNTLSLINQLHQDYAEAAGSTATQERLEAEIERQQLALLSYRTQAANLKSKLATRTMDSIRYADMRQFAYAIYIQGVSHTDTIDEPVMYEVEVAYATADSPKENQAGVVMRWFYSRRRNVAEINWESMERTYEEATSTTGTFNAIYVPIRFGERISYRVRAIGESGQVSEYGSYYSYSFTGYTVSQQYIMVNNIYNLLYPDPYQEGIITQELVDLMKSVIDEYRDKTNRIVALESRVSTLISEV